MQAKTASSFALSGRDLPPTNIVRNDVTGQYGHPCILTLPPVMAAGAYSLLASPSSKFAWMTPPFRTTLWRVLGIQLVTLALLWLLQSRYAT